MHSFRQHRNTCAAGSTCARVATAETRARKTSSTLFSARARAKVVSISWAELPSTWSIPGENRAQH